MLCLVALMVSNGTAAQSFDSTTIKLFKALHRQPNALARYSYLDKVMPHLSATDQVVALQLLSSAESELGLYNRAVLGFPLKVSAPTDITLPTTTDWRAADAVNVIAKLAADRRIVLINEAHHDAHTRLLTLELLPRLRAIGFNYFAAEALLDTDPELEKRGYAVKTSGTEYLHEPLYGEIIREAIRLGFTIVPYDIEGNVSTQARDIGQADNLYRKVFAKDPDARLFIQAGYAHIDKAKGRLGNVEPMAMRLQTLVGATPLSIDQTQFLETGLDRSDDYHQLIANFKPKTPAVLVNRANGKIWSARPKLYDVNVILPPAVSLRSFGDQDMLGGEAIKNVSDSSRLSLGALITLNPMLRPNWLTLGGTRRSVPISATLCRTRLPCVIEAQYANERNDAIAADRYTFMKSNAISELYLRPGQYRLRAWGINGKTLSEHSITIDRAQ